MLLRILHDATAAAATPTTRLQGRPPRIKCPISNWWVLGKNAVIGMLEACGLTDVKVVFSWSNPEVLGGTQFERTCFYARKPS